MNKESVRGWRDVFGFTLAQTLKSKSYRASMIIMVVLVLISMPVMNHFMATPDMTGEGEMSEIEKVYVYNMTMYRNLDIQSELAQGFKNVVFENTSENYEEVEKRISEEELNSVILMIVEDEAGSYLQFMRAVDSNVSMYELSLLGQYVQNAYTKAKVRALGISEDQMKKLSVSVVASSAVVDTESAVILEDTSISQSEYWFLYGLLFVVLMISVMSSSQVATSIASDKSSKVVEYLLTSVRPLALIIGKVLAMLLSVILQMAVVIFAGFVSAKVGQSLLGGAPNAIAKYISPEILSNLNFGNILIGVIVAAIGILFYATLAGLCGATVSRMEEVSESLVVLTFASLAGAYIGIGAAASLMGAGDNAFVTFALIFPLSSSFLLPGALLIGKADLMISVIAIVVLILSVILLFLFVAKVYETLILYNGKRMKMKDVFAIFKGQKKTKKKED